MGAHGTCNLDHSCGKRSLGSAIGLPDGRRARKPELGQLPRDAKSWPTQPGCGSPGFSRRIQNLV
jgi:hypothetical protein